MPPAPARAAGRAAPGPGTDAPRPSSGGPCRRRSQPRSCRPMQDHEQAGCERQDALRPRRRRCARPARTEPGSEEADQPADEAVGGHAAEIVAQLAHQRGGAPARIGPQRAGEAAAHADAVPAARDPGDERSADTRSRRDRRAIGARTWVAATKVELTARCRLLRDRQVGDPDEEGDGHDDEQRLPPAPG